MEIHQGTLCNKNNYKSGRASDIKYIVIHYTGNKGDTALNNIKYFSSNTVKASAHYFVDEGNVYISVPVSDTAWHCGGSLQGNQGHEWFGSCKNANSIGIEMCMLDKNGNIRQGTVDVSIQLVRELMKKYNISADNVIRHYDVTGKICPEPFVSDESKWKDFKSRLNQKGDVSYVEEIKKINEMITLIGADIEKLNQRITAVETENNRQNDIINLVGQDIAALQK